jgi:hypothetical protein
LKPAEVITELGKESNHSLSYIKYKPTMPQSYLIEKQLTFTESFLPDSTVIQQNSTTFGAGSCFK